MGDVLDLDIERRGFEQIEPAPAQHALPGARPHWLRAGKALHALIEDQLCGFTTEHENMDETDA